MRPSPRGDQPGSLSRMWYRFEWPEALQDAIARDVIVGLVGGLTTVFSDGCGVSGFDESDCLALVREQLFNGENLPETCDRVPDVDVSTLPAHLQDHLGDPSRRGVWFPPLNLKTAL